MSIGHHKDLQNNWKRIFEIEVDEEQQVPEDYDEGIDYPHQPQRQMNTPER